jgi:hypothetical protein
MGTLIVFAAGYLVSYRSIERLFFLHVIDRLNARKKASANDLLAQGAGQTDGPPRRTLVLYPPKNLAKELRQRTSVFPAAGATAGNSSDCVWLIDELEPLLRAPESASVMSLLTTSKTPVIALCRVDPLRRLSAAQRAPWAAVLAGFDEIEWPMPSGSASVDATPNRAFLETIWYDCDQNEQCVLGQLATDGYANPNEATGSTLAHLASRGLICPNTLTISNDAFAEVVRSSLSPGQMARWEAADGKSIWTAVRVPLSTGVALLLAALGISQPELAAAGVLAPTVAAGLPAMMRVIAAIVNGHKLAAGRP